MSFIVMRHGLPDLDVINFAKSPKILLEFRPVISDEHLRVDAISNKPILHRVGDGGRVDLWECDGVGPSSGHIDHGESILVTPLALREMENIQHPHVTRDVAPEVPLNALLRGATPASLTYATRLSDSHHVREHARPVEIFPESLPGFHRTKVSRPVSSVELRNDGTSQQLWYVNLTYRRQHHALTGVTVPQLD
jgi:hypothetical protein